MAAGASGVSESLIDRRQRVLGRHAPLFYERPVQLVRGDGVWAYDETGKRYLDAYNNVPHVGHCHPHVVAALAKQSATLSVHTRYLHDGIVTYAERLLATFDRSLSVAMFCCTGTEANELALRLARCSTGNTGIIVTSFSYHGNSSELAALTTAFATPEGFAAYARAIDIPGAEPAGKAPAAPAAGAYAQDIEAAIASLAAQGLRPAALLIDTSFANEGLPAVPQGFVSAAVRCVREAGGLFIADEVQSGFGRTGQHMWSFGAHDVVPDIVTLGKPMGNGYPLAAVIARADLVEAFGRCYFNTFAGSPVAAAVGMAVLDVIEGEDLVANARRVGAYVRRGLQELMAEHELVGDVLGQGLFFGVELVRNRSTRAPAADAARTIVNRLRERGVLVGVIGPRENVLKMRPPMVFTTEHADLLLSELRTALRSI